MGAVMKGVVSRLFLVTTLAWFSLSTRMTATQPTSTASGPLAVSKINPRYFADPSGRIVYLTGSHTWENGMEERRTIDPPSPFDFTRFINFLVSHNHNWFRMWTAELANVEAGG